MSTYIAGASIGASDAQAASNNVTDIAAAARNNILKPQNQGPLLHTNRG
jgi:hypothetical protein